uniref:Secreted protein n=1 Tax=Caenorhabditis japonica TaxID=281687 RepID=A0A8R1EFZ8_CAEJA
MARLMFVYLFFHYLFSYRPPKKGSGNLQFFCCFFSSDGGLVWFHLLAPTDRPSMCLPHRFHLYRFLFIQLQQKQNRPSSKKQ